MAEVEGQTTFWFIHVKDLLSLVSKSRNITNIRYMKASHVMQAGNSLVQSVCHSQMF
jgi:hypothetical protein